MNVRSFSSIIVFTLFALNFLVLPNHFSSVQHRSHTFEKVEVESFFLASEKIEKRLLVPKIVLEDSLINLSLDLLFLIKIEFQYLSSSSLVFNEKFRARPPPVLI